MCGGMKYYPDNKLTKDELTTLISMVIKEQENQLYYFRVLSMTDGDKEISKSVTRLEELLKKLEIMRSGNHECKCTM